MARKTAITRYLNGLKVVDATKPLSVTVLTKDIKNGKVKSPSECVIARACKREYGAKEVMILRRTAYVDLPTGPNGQREMNRFLLGSNSQLNVAVFDTTSKAFPGGFALVPPYPKSTLEARRRYGNQYNQQIRDGMRKPKKNRKFGKHAARTALLDVRDGTGHIHFKKTRT